MELFLLPETPAGSDKAQSVMRHKSLS
ncbi:hypothetical protein CHELA20_54127 [Hyphomicrobiales bacterium]|nr:hypothetical protein CHELA20_54127 [Hyphomicrobiales bacterium]